MARFVGRTGELSQLRRLFDGVSRSGDGVLLSVRGRRQVGKSRLIDEFLRTTGAPGVFFAAARRKPVAEEVAGFAAEVAASALESAALFQGVEFAHWESVLRTLASGISQPAIVVVDELPFLLEQDPTLEGILQRVWDRYLSRVPVLLIVIGSDLSMMEALGRYDRPLYQRMREMVVNPLNPAETARMLQLPPALALDAHLIHGGFPTLAQAWKPGASIEQFLDDQLTDSTSPLVVMGERILNVEFPPDLQARAVLEVIGAGSSTFATIGERTGVNQGSLTRTLDALVNDKRVVAVQRPLSGKRSRLAHYSVGDFYLRFWLRFLGPHLELLARDRGDALVELIRREWTRYRGRAIEPLVRSAIERMLPDDRFGEARYVGSYWTRSSDLEVDLVGGRELEPPTEATFLGSVKWRESAKFNRSDLSALAAARSQVPGATGARLVGVSRTGFTTGELDTALTPTELLAAWDS